MLARLFDKPTLKPESTTKAVAVQVDPEMFLSLGSQFRESLNGPEWWRDGFGAADDDAVDLAVLFGMQQAPVGSTTAFLVSEKDRVTQLLAVRLTC